MDPVRNPYSPGAGRPPAALVGREQQLRAWDVALRRVEAGRGAQSIVLFGLRGVGKTVLLSRFAKMSSERGWLVAQVEGKSGKSVRELVGEAFHDALVDLARPSAGVRVLKALKTALSFKASYDQTGTWNFGLDLSNSPGGGADTGTFESDVGKLLRDLSGAAAGNGIGVALLVDEAQDLPDPELVALCAIVHAATQRQEPLLLAFAGLPSLPRKLAEAKSYAERLFDYHTVDGLAPAEARAALVDPAAEEGVAWDDEALTVVTDAAAGYPYFLQQFGQETWNASAASPIAANSAELGVARGQRALDTGFFRIRWDRATTSEKQYLKAMAPDGDSGSSSGEVANRLRKKANALGPIRASLIAKGLVYSPDHGVVAYTVPAMSAFVSRQESQDL